MCDLARRRVGRTDEHSGFSKSNPDLSKGSAAAEARRDPQRLPAEYPIDTHFPPYDPWGQRLCAVPDGDLV
jgi:hypothetical protein